MQLIWATDIHLDHCNDETIAAFTQSIQSSKGDALCLTGDLSEAPSLKAHLEELAEQIEIPIFFILGNHDYYHGSLKSVRQEMRQLTEDSRWLNWMPAAGLIPLTEQTCIIGHDCWGDGRNGDVYGSWLKLSDFRLIEDLKQAFEIGGEKGRVDLLNALGDQGAEHLRKYLPRALEQYQEVILLMHPPPFRETCLYGTEMADDNWAPHFTCKAVGDLLLEILPQYPNGQVTVLAGHTHNICERQHLENLHIKVGTAEYGTPLLAETLTLP